MLTSEAALNVLMALNLLGFLCWWYSAKKNQSLNKELRYKMRMFDKQREIYDRLYKEILTCCDLEMAKKIIYKFEDNRYFLVEREF